MDDTQQKKAEFFQEVWRGGKELTLSGLLKLIDMEEAPLLEQVQRAQAFLDENRFNCIPTLGRGDFDTPRIVLPPTHPRFDEEIITELIEIGESQNLEIKSSLCYDFNRALHDQDATSIQLKSEQVTLATLKNVAAMLNCGGGIVLIGISDEGVWRGIEFDCKALGYDGLDCDKWELHLRDSIEGKFLDGRALNDYIRVSMFTKGKITIAQVEIIARENLSFVNGTNRDLDLYRRQGNRTVKVEINEVLEFQNSRIQQNWVDNLIE